MEGGCGDWEECLECPVIVSLCLIANKFLGHWRFIDSCFDSSRHCVQLDLQLKG